MKSYLSSEGGRLMVATVGLALLAAGALAVAGPGGHALWVVILVPLLCAVGSIVAIGLSVNEFGHQALGLLIALPFLGGPYLAALHKLPGRGPFLGALLFAIGAGAVFFAASGYRRIRLAPAPADLS